MMDAGLLSCCVHDEAVVEVSKPTPLKEDDHLATLLAALEGDLQRFGDAGYEEARLGRLWKKADCVPGDGRKGFSPETHPTETWNLDACAWPAAICVVASVADVRAAVVYCAATSCTLAIAGGRHSHTCMVQDSFVVDLQRLRWATFEEKGGVGYLSCGGGALNGDAHRALDGTGWCMTLGHHPGTGLGGLVQQGGHGPLEKLFGLSVDAMVGAEVVTADGAARCCDEETEADLFWAIRGGCGNFGVVTRFTFRLQKFDQKLPSLTRVHFPIPFVMPSRRSLVASFRDHCEGAMPRNVSPLLILTPFPVVELYYAIGQGDTSAALEPYEAFGRPLVVKRGTRDFIHECSWDILGPSSDDALADNYYPTSSFLGALPDEACAIIADAAARMPPKCGLVLNQLGGAAEDVPKDATAVYHRDGKYWLIIQASWTSPADRESRVAWAKSLRDALMPFCVGRYGALSDDAPFYNDVTDSADPLAFASWGANYPRLRALKRAYDPANLFKVNHNIAPADSDDAAPPS